MPLHITFNGKILTIPSAYSTIDYSNLTGVPQGNFGICTYLTTSDIANPSLVATFTDSNSLQTYVGSNSPLYPLAPLIFKPSNDARIGSPNYVNVVIVNNPTQAKYTDAYFTFTSNSFGTNGNYTSFDYTINTSSSISLSVTDGISGTTNDYTISQTAGSIAYSGIGSYTISKSGNTITVGGTPYDATKILIASFNQFLSGISSSLSFTSSTKYIGNTIATLDDFSASISSGSPTSVYLNVWYLNNQFSDPYISVLVNTSSLISNTQVSEVSQLAGGYVHSLNNTSTSIITQLDIERATNLIDKTYTNTLSITADGQSDVNMGYNLVYQDAENLLSYLKSVVDTRNTLNEANYTSLFVGYNATSFSDATTFQQSMNDPGVTVYIQNIQNPYDSNTYTPYAMGVIGAALGASLPLGTSFTRKSINVLKATFQFTYQLNRVNKEALIENGIQFLDQSSNGTWYIVKGNTSYTQTDNDGYTDTGTQLLSQYLLYDFNQYMSQLIGQDISSASPSAPRIAPLVNPGTVTQFVIDKAENWKTLGYITDVTDSTGKIVTPAYSNIIVSIANKTASVNFSIVETSGVEFVVSVITDLPYVVNG